MAVMPVLSGDMFTISTLVPTEMPASVRGKGKLEQFLLSACNAHDGNVVDERGTVFQSKQLVWKLKVKEPTDREVWVLCILGPSNGSRGVTQFHCHGGSLANLIYIAPINFWTHNIGSTEYLCLKDKFKVTRIKENKC